MRNGVILSLVGCDGGGHLLPLCFAHVSSETAENTRWFLRIAKEQMPALLEAEPGVAVFADLGSAIRSALEEEFKEEKGHILYCCVFHRKQNMQQAFKDHPAYEAIISTFMEAANALTIEDHTTAMRELDRLEHNAWVKASEINPKTWARALMGPKAFGKCTSNDAEV